MSAIALNVNENEIRELSMEEIGEVGGGVVAAVAIAGFAIVAGGYYAYTNWNQIKENVSDMLP